MVKRLLLVALVVLSLTGVAYGWGILGATGSISSSGGVGGGTWGTWDESSQENLLGFDYCVFFDSAVDSSNDTGYSASGLFSGASLVATQNGGISGTTDGETRQTNTGQYFTINDGSAEAIASGSGASNWFFAWKIKSLIHPGSPQDFFNFYSDDAVAAYIRIKVHNDGRLEFASILSGGSGWASTTDDSIDNGIDDTTYICFWYDGTGTPSVRGGFVTGTTKPTQWSDFDTGSRVSGPLAWNADNFNTQSDIVSQSGTGVTVNVYYFVADSDTVITN